MKTFLLFSHIAFRNVRRNTRRSLFTIAAIAFGLLCLIIFQSLKTGLHREMVSSTIRLDAGNLQIHAAGYEINLASFIKMAEPEKVVRALTDAGETKFSRRLKSSALLLADRKSSSIMLSGIEPGEEAGVTFIKQKVIEGSYLSGSRGILIGDALARNIGIRLGDEITVALQDSKGLPVTNKIPVTGIYRTELASFDRTHAFMQLRDLQSILDAAGNITEIAVRTEGMNETGLSDKLKAALSVKDYQVRTWQQIAPDVIQLIELNDATMQLLILIVFAIIAMGITNTMTMVVFERFRELGILSAIGTSPSGILAMVVMESFFLGAIASIIGSLAAAGACSYLAQHGIDLTRFTSNNQYFANSHVLKAHLLIKDLLIANAVTLLTALAGGIYPSWKASRLRPVDAISHS